MSDRRATYLLWSVLATFVLAGGLSFYALALARANHAPVALWLANGALIGWLVQKPLVRTWPLLVAAFLGYLAAKLSLGDALLPSMLIGPCQALETVIVSESIRRRFPQLTAQTRFMDLARVGIVSALVGSVLCAFGKMSILHLWSQPDPWVSLNTLFRAHFVGMAIAGSASLVVAIPALRRFERRRTWIVVRDFALMTAVTMGVFVESRVPMAFLIYPPLLLLVFRYRFVGMVAGMVILAVVISLATTLNIGPFNLVAGVTPAFRVVMAQVFIGVSCFVALPIALALADQERLRNGMRESELRYRMLAEHSGDLVMRIRANGDRMYVSPSVKELLGWDVEEFQQPRPDLIHPDDRERICAEVAKLRAHGGTLTATYGCNTRMATICGWKPLRAWCRARTAMARWTSSTPAATSPSACASSRPCWKARRSCAPSPTTCRQSSRASTPAGTTPTSIASSNRFPVRRPRRSSARQCARCMAMPSTIA